MLASTSASTRMFANTDSGLWPLDATTGDPILGGPLNSMSVNAGNGRGIDLDPISVPTNHVVYAGADCDPAMRPTAVACTLWDYDMTAGSDEGVRALPSHGDGDVREPVFRTRWQQRLPVLSRQRRDTQGLAVISRPAALITIAKHNR